MKADFSRRTLLKGAGVIAGSASLGFPSLSLAQTGPIRIGVTNALSGPNALYGESNVVGQRLVVEQYNRAGGVLGRQLELVVRDDRAQAAAGTAIAQEFAGSGIQFLAGGGATFVAIAYCGLVTDLKMLYVCSTPGMAITHEAFNRNVFRFNPNAYSLFGAQGRVLAERYPNVSKWGAITPDYAFGHDAARVFGNALKQYHPKRASKDFEVAKPIVVSGAQTDFRPQINSLMNSNIEGLFIGMPGAPGSLASPSEAGVAGRGAPSQASVKRRPGRAPQCWSPRTISTPETQFDAAYLCAPWIKRSIPEPPTLRRTRFKLFRKTAHVVMAAHKKL